MYRRRLKLLALLALVALVGGSVLPAVAAEVSPGEVKARLEYYTLPG